MKEQGYFDVSLRTSTIIAVAGLAGLLATHVWAGAFIVQALGTLPLVMPWLIAGRL